MVDETGTEVKGSSVQYNDRGFFYKYSGSEPGTHRIGMMSTSGEFTDVTKNVTDIEYMTIYDYSITPEKLYFSGYDGLNTICGVITLDSLSYEALDSEYALTGIEVLD